MHGIMVVDLNQLFPNFLDYDKNLPLTIPLDT